MRLHCLTRLTNEKGALINTAVRTSNPTTRKTVPDIDWTNKLGAFNGLSKYDIHDVWENFFTVAKGYIVNEKDMNDIFGILAKNLKVSEQDMTVMVKKMFQNFHPENTVSTSIYIKAVSVC